MPLRVGNPNLFEVTSGNVQPWGYDLIEYTTSDNPGYLRILDYTNKQSIVGVGAGATEEITFDLPHGLTTGDTVWFADFGGLESLFGEQTVTVVSATKITIGTPYTPEDWLGGGSVRKIKWTSGALSKSTYGTDLTTLRLVAQIPATVELVVGAEYILAYYQAPVDIMITSFYAFSVYREFKEKAIGGVL